MNAVTGWKRTGLRHPAMALEITPRLPGARSKQLANPKGTEKSSRGRVVFARERPSVEKLYRIYVERNITKDRAEQLGVQRWHRWESGKSSHDFGWEVDEQVYITKGCLQVKPLDCPDSAFFYAGDLVRFPKWFQATLTIDEAYEHRYRFLAYGEGEG